MVDFQLTREDHARVAEAIRLAEQRTSAEIVCVVARAASDYAALPYLWSTLFALALPWPLIVLTGWSVQWIFAAQLVAFAVAFAILSFGQIRVALAPAPMRRAHAHRAALEQFMLRGIGRTRARTGVLIFISLAERFVRVLPDDVVAEAIPRQEWQGVVQGLVAHLRQGRVSEGLAEAVARSGDLLAAHLPAQGEAPNELPNRLYLI